MFIICLFIGHLLKGNTWVIDEGNTCMSMCRMTLVSTKTRNMWEAYSPFFLALVQRQELRGPDWTQLHYYSLTECNGSFPFSLSEFPTDTQYEIFLHILFTVRNMKVFYSKYEKRTTFWEGSHLFVLQPFWITVPLTAWFISLCCRMALNIIQFAFCSYIEMSHSAA